MALDLLRKAYPALKLAVLNPALILALLSPFLAEVLFGATPISNFDAAPVILLIYGSAVLLVRETTRKFDGSDRWIRIFLLGAAHAVVEEGLSLRSLFDDNLFNSSIIGGRAFGVNWLWSQWAFGYHIIWSNCVPIVLAEALFADRQHTRWTTNTWLVVALIAFIAGNCMLGFVFRTIIRPEFSLSLTQTVGSCLAVMLFVALALFLPRQPRAPSAATVRSPLSIALGAALVGFSWFALLNLPHAIRPLPCTLLPMAITATLAAVFLRWLSRSSLPTQRHRLALVIGALIPSCAFGFVYVTATNQLDQAVQGVLSLIVLVVLTVRYLRAESREAVTAAKAE